MKIDYTKIANAKVRIIRPILDKWNDCHGDTWEITKTGCLDCCEIRRNGEQKNNVGIHGCLLSDILGISNAYDWTLAVYRDVEGLYIHL